MARLSGGVTGALLLGAGSFFGQALWLEAKAELAQYLIAGAWARTLAGGDAVRPWSWADTWPVARLTTPAGDAVYVLHGIHGQALAFGPGHLPASALPGERRAMIVAGHRDSHFAFLETVAAGDVIGVEDRRGRVYHYRVTDARVVDSRTHVLSPATGDERLVLVTCYPFDALSPGGPLRYVVTALPARGDNEDNHGGDGSTH